MLLPQDFFTKGGKRSNAAPQLCSWTPALPPHRNALLRAGPDAAIPQRSGTVPVSGSTNRKPGDSK